MHVIEWELALTNPSQIDQMAKVSNCENITLRVVANDSESEVSIYLDSFKNNIYAEFSDFNIFDQHKNFINVKIWFEANIELELEMY
jgi:hypothetical protein